MFIQGLITNDVFRIVPSSSFNAAPTPTMVADARQSARALEPATIDQSNAIFGAFLNAKSRIIADVNVIAPSPSSLRDPNDTLLLIDCDRNAAASLMAQLKLFKLRKQVTIDDATAMYQPWSLVSSDPQLASSLLNEIRQNKSIVAVQDPRSESMGIRMYLPESQTPQSVLPHAGISTASKDDVSLFHRLRMVNGIPEGDSETKNNFPLEMNFEYLNGVSFTKGCYTGQELVARTHHRGEVRKRLIPVVIGDGSGEDPELISKAGDLLPPWALGFITQQLSEFPIPIHHDTGIESTTETSNESSTTNEGAAEDRGGPVEVGKLISAVQSGGRTGSIGLAMFRLSNLTPTSVGNLCIMSAGSKIPITPILPSWMELSSD